MTVVAPLNYERYTVVLNPLMMPTEAFVVSQHGSYETQAVTKKRANFDLSGSQSFDGKTKQSRSSLAKNASLLPTQTSPLTSSGPPSHLNASAFLPNLLANRQSSLSAADVARFYGAASLSNKYALTSN